MWKIPGLLLVFVLSGTGVACCSMGSVMGTLPNTEDGQGKIRDRASSGYIFTWHLYPKYLPNWSYKTAGVGIAVGVEDWSSSPIAYPGPDLSYSPFREIPEVAVIWIAIDPKDRAKVSLDPNRVRLRPSDSPRSVSPVCIVQGRTWKGGIECDPSQSAVANAAIQAYRSRWPSAPWTSDALSRIPLQDDSYTYLVFAIPDKRVQDSTLEIEGIESDGTVLHIPKLELKSFEYRELMCSM